MALESGNVLVSLMMLPAVAEVIRATRPPTPSVPADHGSKPAIGRIPQVN
jgi:hypothetical protein